MSPTLFGHTIAVINTATLALEKTMISGGLSTDVKIAGPWGIVSGHSSTNALNEPVGGMEYRIAPARTADAERRDGPSVFAGDV